MQFAKSLSQDYSKGLCEPPYAPGACLRAAVIIEPRRHEFLGPVVANFLKHLGPGWVLRLFTSQVNLQANCEAIAPLIVPHAFHTHLLPFDNLTIELYNTLLMSRGFWLGIPEEEILIFQTDCILFRPIPQIFHLYAYAGANYYSPAEVAPRYGGIQGGLSLRRRSAMLKCLLVAREDIQKYRASHGLAPLNRWQEDVYFTHACEILKLNVPTPEQRRQLFIECSSDYTPGTCGHHGWHHGYFIEEHQEILLTTPS